MILLGVGFVSSCDKAIMPVVDDVCLQMDDIKFMDYCYTNFDVNHDGKVSMSEAAAVHSIDIKKKGVLSLNGIEYFTALYDLDCSDNYLKSLDVSKNTALEVLYCNSTQLTSLDVSKNTNLYMLECAKNQLTSLDVSNNLSLIYLSCSKNPNLTELWLKNGQDIQILYCDSATTIKYKN